MGVALTVTPFSFNRPDFGTVAEISALVQCNKSLQCVPADNNLSAYTEYRELVPLYELAHGVPADTRI